MVSEKAEEAEEHGEHKHRYSTEVLDTGTQVSQSHPLIATVKADGLVGIKRATLAVVSIELILLPAVDRLLRPGAPGAEQATGVTDIHDDGGERDHSTVHDHW